MGSYLQKGKGAVEELLDPQLKCNLRFSNQIGGMIEAATACVTNEKSRKPDIHKIIAILKGEEKPVFSKRKFTFSLGVSEFEDDGYFYVC
jgi:hypothetical protein